MRSIRTCQKRAAVGEGDMRDTDTYLPTYSSLSFTSYLIWLLGGKKSPRSGRYAIKSDVKDQLIDNTVSITCKSHPLM